MPAKHLHRNSSERGYSHIYNRGVEGRSIFLSEDDYQTFLTFLEEYLSDPSKTTVKKQSFTVKGQVYKGVPHQPKNYYGKVELLAYSLSTDHFHLVLHQTVKNSIESLLRSLLTRYSIYFNKKYARSGSLFSGPYKSVQVKEFQLASLCKYLHNHQTPHSSLDEYKGNKASSWVKSDLVPQVLENQEELPDELKLESKVKPLPKPIEPKTISKQPKKSQFRYAEIFAASLLFLLLTGLGLKNINAQTQSHQVLSDTISKTPSPTPISSPEASYTPKIIVVVRIADGANSVNVRTAPSLESEKIGTVKDGDTLEYISNTPGWFEIKLPNGSNGFISANYIEGGAKK